MKQPERVHVYKRGEGYSLELDVYLPDNPPKRLPVVVYIHGGALIWGGRRDVNEHEIASVTAEGMAYVSIDYRLAPETAITELTKDVADALEWVRDEGAGLYGFDAKRIAVSGKSAGGYLALLSGTFSNKPKAIVSYYGYGDILGAWYSSPSAHYLKSPLVSWNTAKACVMPGTPTSAGEEARWPLYLYARQTGKWASIVSGYGDAELPAALKPLCPIQNIAANYPPTFLLHGSDDTDVPCEQSLDMHAALVDAGVDARLCVLPGAGHGFEWAWRNTPEEFGLVVNFLKETL